MDTKELEHSLSMDEILKTIRSVVSEGMEKQENKDDDILELTEIVEVGHVIDTSTVKTKDVLDTIDEIIGEKKSPDTQKVLPPEVEAPKKEEIKNKEDNLEKQSSQVNSDNTKLNEQSEKKESSLSEPKPQPSTGDKVTSGPTVQEPLKVEDVKKDEQTASVPIPEVKDLISAKAIEASSEALKLLISEDKNNDIGDVGPKTTLEELMIKILTPMLSKWLDERLPDIIQEIVEREIKKIVQKAKK